MTRALVALIVSVPGLLLAQYDTMWVRQVARPITTTCFNRAADAYVDAAGNVYACGMLHVYNNVNRMGLAKYGPYGDSLWTIGLGAVANGATIAHALAPDPHGNTYLAGQIQQSGGLNAALVKYRPDGTYAGYNAISTPQDDAFFDVVTTPDGSIYACGARYNSALGSADFLVVKFDTTLDTIWTRSYDLDEVASSGRGSAQTFTARFRARHQDDPQLDRLPEVFDDYDDYENCATALAVCPDGSIAVTGYGYDDAIYNYEMWTMKFAPDGELLWQSTYHCGDMEGHTYPDYDVEDAAFDIAVAQDGSIYIAGFDYLCHDDGAEGYDSDWNFAVVRYDENGVRLAYQSVDQGIEWDDCATEIVLDEGDPENVYVTGWVNYNSDVRLTTHKFSHDLASRRWGTRGARYVDGSYGYGLDYASGRVFVTGCVGYGDYQDLVVLGYTDADASTKTPIWSYVYGHPDLRADVGTAVVAPDSNVVYVVGESSRDPVGGYNWSSMMLGRFFNPRRDIAATKIIEPVGAKDFNSANTPQLEVSNLGNAPTTFTVRFDISDGYTNSQVARLAFGQTDTLDFASWTADTSGSFAVRCTVSVAGDISQPNNLVTGTVGVLPPAPLALAPGNGAVLTTLQPLLQVGDGELDAVDSFHFRLYQDSLVRESRRTGTDWTIAPPVYNGRSYTWDCQAHSAAGWGPYFSPRWGFSIAILPGVPVQSTPANGSDVATLTPELAVRKLATDVEMYHFRVWQADSLVREDSVADTSWVIGSALYNGRTYRWDCRAKNAAGWGTFSGEWTFNVRVLPSAPVPQQPGNGGTVYTLTPDLAVGAVPDADRYHFRVYEGGSLVVEDDQAPANSWTVGLPLESGHTYEWDCRVHNAADWGPFFSPRWTFAVTTLPAPPEPLAPANGGDITTLAPELQVVDAGAPIDRYHFRVYDGGALVRENTDVGATWTVSPELENGKTYDWDCAAHNPVGWGDFFEPRWTFNTRILPQPPQPVAPAQGSIVGVWRPVLEVVPIADAVHYNFQVYDTETDALVTEATIEDSDWTVDIDLTNGRQYWWQCRAENAAGWGDYFAPRWDFTVGVLPNAPSPLLPEDGDEVISRTPPLCVGRVADAVEYHYQVYDTETDALLVEGYVPDTSWTVGLELERNREYWWQVRCRNVAGWGAYFGPRWSFLVARFDVWPAGWHEVEPVPALPSMKEVRDGAWLAVHAETMLYVAKGNKTGDFFSYEPFGDSWATLESVPGGEDGRNKPPKKGCVGAAVPPGSMYMVKGNNTFGFWHYDIAGNSWHRMPGVPPGPNGKTVKGGTDLVYVEQQDTGWLYLLKGYRSEFYRYNVAAARWDTLPDVPYVLSDRFKPGSFLVYDGSNTIYCHQASYLDGTYHYMYRFDLRGDTWYQGRVRGMPLYGQHGARVSKKKSKDGAAGAWFDEMMYALKGGNTQQFFRYRPGPDSWAEIETMPTFGSTQKRKRVKNGGDMVFAMNAMWALKGNKTLELWRYGIDFGQGAGLFTRRDGVAGQGRLQNADCRMQIAPNPLNSGYATINYSLPKAGPVSVTIVDVAGRSVLVTRSPGHLVTGSLPLDLRGLSAGVYLVRLDADGYTQSQKLVVQR